MNKFKLWITKFLLKWWGLNFSRLMYFKIPGIQQFEVALFEKKHDLFTAKALPFLNVIVAEGHFFKRYSKNVQNFIMAHEYAHTRVHWLLDILLIAVLLFLLLSISGFTVIIPILVILAILKGGFFVSILIYNLITLALCVLLFSFFSWLSEGYAEWNAVKTIGLKQSKQAYKEMLRKKEKTSLYNRFVNGWTHPPMLLILYLFEKFHRN